MQSFSGGQASCLRTPGVSAESDLGCDVVLPCRNEALSLPRVFQNWPRGLRAVVVDNASTDGTAAVARRYGVEVVPAPVPGYGSAVHAGVLAARAPFVAVLDADGSMSPSDVLPMLELVRTGRVTMAVGRRRPTARNVWPWHARAGTSVLAWWLRRRTGLAVHDITPIRVCRRDDLLALDVKDRRFGYPLELLLRAAHAGWRVHEVDVSYGPRVLGTRSKVSGSLRGTLLAISDFARVLS